MNRDENYVVEKFKRLVANGTVFFDEDPRVVTYEEKGLQFEFRVTTALAGKPTISPTQQDDPEQHPEQPASEGIQGCRPGSDIDVSGFEIQSVGKTHFLAINKFCAVKPHLLLLTQNGFRRQYEPLDISDFESAKLAVNCFQRPYLIFYNCRVEGGCSRLHKHMQAIPSPEGGPGFTLWPDWNVAQRACIPFHHFIRRFEDGIPVPELLLEIYLSLLAEAEMVLQEDMQGDDRAIPHNVAMNHRWIVVIPRQKANADGLGVNAAGMLGLVWLSNDSTLDDWMEKGPVNVMTEVGVIRKL